MAQWIERLRTGGVRTVAAVVVVALLVTGGTLTLRAKDDSSAVARVNGVTITKGELFDEMYSYVGEQVLDELILMKLIHMEAADRGVAVADADVDAELGKFAEQVGGLDQLHFLLFQQQMTLDDFAEQIRNNLLIKALMAPDVVIDEDDVKEVFEANKDYFAEDEQVRARHILVETKAEADALRKQLLDGHDFAELAKEHSTDLGSGAQGGDLGWFGRGVMVAPFEEAAFALAVGDISPPVQSDFGYHIIRVDEKADAKPAQFDEETAAFIRDQLVDEQVQQRLPTWLNALRTAADVEILLDK